jgi:hypothetical protein
MIEAVSSLLGPVLDEFKVVLGQIRVQHNDILIINDLYDMPRTPLLAVCQWPALHSHLQRDT